MKLITAEITWLTTTAVELAKQTHSLLHNRIWRSNDPIWLVIYPPNGWNCRCYINPMTVEEVSSAGIEPEQVIDSKSRTELLNQAKVPKEFRRNSGDSRSIWGKWLGSKLTDKVYDEITNRLKGYANQMPDADEVIETLNKNQSHLENLDILKRIGSWLS